MIDLSGQVEPFNNIAVRTVLLSHIHFMWFHNHHCTWADFYCVFFSYVKGEIVSAVVSLGGLYRQNRVSWSALKIANLILFKSYLQLKTL